MRPDRRSLAFALSTLVWLVQPAPVLPQKGPDACTAYRKVRVPQSFTGCAELEAKVREPASFMNEDGGTFRLDKYEQLLVEFFGKYCHRAPGWKRDKMLRDTGPYVSLLDDGAWAPPSAYGTHLPVVIWYDETMYRWLQVNRGEPAVADPPPVPDGAIMVKEMYPAPAARCSWEQRLNPEHLEPEASGIAFMIRDSKSAIDGWFWGAWWPTFQPDWPAQEGNPLPNMGFGLYCLNCHASANDNQTFAALKNLQGEKGEVNVYLTQNFLFENDLVGEPPAGRHRTVSDTSNDAVRHGQPLADYDQDFSARFHLPGSSPPETSAGLEMPSETYDHVWVPGDQSRASASSEFLTSDQCIGCHDAGSTGLQFDMTAAAPRLGALLNLSPYATWRTSPMGLGGRDPIFFAQLESESQTFHPEQSGLVQDTCLGCHGLSGQRQYKIVHGEGTTAQPSYFLRQYADAVPYPSDVAQNPQLPLAPFAARARDGISCPACHHTVLSREDTDANKDEGYNTGVAARQKVLGQDVNTGFARTFTGSFFVGPPDKFRGPFPKPKPLPMEHTLGIEPVYEPDVKNSGICGTCHTIYLPIFYGDESLGNTYEQTTYPEWAMSAYRTGANPWDGSQELPSGAGSLAESCQGCHMPGKDRAGNVFASKIASIQEHSNFPASDNVLGHDDVDLEVREGFARHTLVGLNLFLVEMAQQFPDVLGIRTQDPMMVTNGLDPVLQTERAMLEQAALDTASLRVTAGSDGKSLSSTVSITSKVGHKFPSGVSFRRAFVEFSVLDRDLNVLWASGRTDGAGVIVDENGEPIAGELMWEPDCAGRIPGTAHQPHYQVISRQDNAQIYQELVTAPPEQVPKGVQLKCNCAPKSDHCDEKATPGGQFTTSFLSICDHVKDNRILPAGFLSLEERGLIAKALGVKYYEALAYDTGPVAVGDDPDYVTGGGDSLVYRVDLAGLGGKTPAYVQATLYSQATPPFFLQDRFCTSKSDDTRRLFYLAGHLNLEGSRAEDWKLEIVSSGLVALE